MTVGSAKGFCYNSSVIFQFIGYVIMVLKIVIPIILVIIGAVALGKAIIEADDQNIKKAFNQLIKKFLTAVFIFFLPTLVNACFGIVNGFSDVEADYNVCLKCVTSPTKDTCKSAVSGSQK